MKNWLLYIFLAIVFIGYAFYRETTEIIACVLWMLFIIGLFAFHHYNNKGKLY